MYNSSINHHIFQSNFLSTINDFVIVSVFLFCQVVVMRVSLHCQACAGKVRKHISKMEGIHISFPNQKKKFHKLAKDIDNPRVSIL